MSKPFVAIFMGSDSDWPVMKSCAEVLDKLQIPYQVRVSSAHRTPEATHQHVTQLEQQGCEVFIAAAGLAAHLGGVIASLTLKPVIGVPMDGGPLKGQDALLSTVQMPGGIPVATVAIGKAGAKNSAYLAGQILALGDSELAARVVAERKNAAAEVIAKNEALQKTL